MIRGLCGCGNLARYKGLGKNGIKLYATNCQTCKRLGKRDKKTYCELCNFIALDPVQLDVDHIDADTSNNDPSNLQTLCANCHRLKTKNNGDWKHKNEKVC
jgi:5-methylcytosine-specific restriction endonuclease McrA